MTEYIYYMFTLYAYQNMLTSKKILLTSVLQYIPHNHVVEPQIWL